MAINDTKGTLPINEFNEWIDAFMNQPKEMVLVRDLHGKIYMTDANKVATISPSKLNAVLDNPALRELVVPPIEQ